MKFLNRTTTMKIVYIVAIFVGLSCNNPNEINQTLLDDSPYRIFFNQLKINKLTDTILVQNRTKIFGCGTAYVMYENELKKKGLHKFYNKYGNVLDDLELINSFERNNAVKILWINRGNEGELFQFQDSSLHLNEKLEKRLIAQKVFLSFDDTPKSLDSVNLTVLINFKDTNKVILKSFDLSKNRNKWQIDKQTERQIKSDF